MKGNAVVEGSSGLESTLESSLASARDMREIRSTLNLIARSRKPHFPFRVLVLAHHGEAWIAVSELVDLMRADPDFDVTVASIPRKFPGSPDFGEEERIHSLLESRGVPHLRFNHRDALLDLDVIKQLDPAVIVRQSQWDEDIPPEFSTRSLSFARLVFIPYAAANMIENPELGNSGDETAVDREFHRACWRVYVGNEDFKNRATDVSVSMRGRQYVVTGHPKADALRRAKSRLANESTPFHVLWSATHSLDAKWNCFGTFLQSAPEMCRLADRNPNWKFTFSPHPALLTMMRNASPPLTVQFVSDFLAAWEALPNTDFFLGGDYSSLFAETSLLVADSLSWIAEYQIMMKPVIFLERPDHLPFTISGKMAYQGMHSCRTVGEAERLIRKFAEGSQDPLREAQGRIAEWLFGAPGAANRILEDLRVGLREDSYEVSS